MKNRATLLFAATILSILSLAQFVSGAVCINCYDYGYYEVGPNCWMLHGCFTPGWYDCVSENCFGACSGDPVACVDGADQYGEDECILLSAQ